MSHHSHAPAPGANSRAADIRTSRWPHISRHLFLSAGLIWLAGCAADGAPPTSPRSGPSVISSTTPTRNYQSLEAILRDLDRVAAVAPATRRMRSTIVVDGRTRELTGLHEIRAALVRSRQANAPRHIDAGSESVSLSAANTDSLRIVFPMSILLTEPSRFRFLSYTSINKLGMARFSFSGSRTVNAVFGNAATHLWTDQGSRVVDEGDGDALVEWPDFTLSSGCEFSATMNTTHGVRWPWGFVIPGFVPRDASSANTGASAPLERDCSGDAGPPLPPPPPSSACIDPALAGCEADNGGSGRSGSTREREVGRSGGSKTVCWVTDWYENGVYIETTYNYCWTELIY